MKTKIHSIAIQLCLVAGSFFQIELANSQEVSQDLVKSREFRFEYAASLFEQNPGAELKVWFPIPTSSKFQEIKIVSWQIPGVLHINKGPRYENRIGFFETTIPETGELSFSLEYQVNRREAAPDQARINEGRRNRFLQKNRMVPISGKPVELIADIQFDSDSMAVGQQLYEVVEQYMSYDKSKPGYGNGDVLWACNSKTGNCTDFHSLFIALARSQGLPARFEIGFPISPETTSGSVGGYHCWAWFHTDEKGWVPVDISEADKHPEMKKYYFGKLTPHRIAFSVGRDIQLYPKSSSSELNYFVYPHMEVAGAQVKPKQIKTEFSFADITSK